MGIGQINRTICKSGEAKHADKNEVLTACCFVICMEERELKLVAASFLIAGPGKLRLTVSSLMTSKHGDCARRVNGILRCKGHAKSKEDLNLLNAEACNRSNQT